MFISDWLHNAAVRGCVAAVFGASLTLAVFAQPVSDDAGRQSSANQAQAQPKPDNTPLVLDAIKGEIEGVRRATEALKDESDPKQKEEREKRDLEAQEGMAFWAMWMFWAAAASIFLTVVGLGMIMGTLIYTKRAAVAARDMVTEGEKATAAAIAATMEAKRQADLAEESYKRLERPYLFLEIIRTVGLTSPGSANHPGLEYRLVNHGKTPAVFKSIFLELRPLTELEFLNGGRPRIPMIAPEKYWYEVVPPGGVLGERRIDVLNSTKGQRSDPNNPLALHGRLNYEDPTRALHTHHFILAQQDGRFVLNYSEHSTEFPQPR